MDLFYQFVGQRKFSGMDFLLLEWISFFQLVGQRKFSRADPFFQFVGQRNVRAMDNGPLLSDFVNVYQSRHLVREKAKLKRKCIVSLLPSSFHFLSFLT